MSSAVPEVSPTREDATPNAPTGFADFVIEHRTQLVRYAMLMTGSVADAEDIVQDVLVRLIPRWDKIDAPLPYVRRSVTNEFISWRRKWSTRNIRLDDDDDDLDRPVFDTYDNQPDPQLWAILLGLPRQHRSALVLRFYEGLTDDEIAGVLECKVATVRSHIHRGIVAIRKQLTATELGEDRA